MTKPGNKLKTERIVPPSSFCWNEQCADYGRLGSDNLRKFGYTRKGRQRWQCKTCGRVVTETRGTVFHGKKHNQQTIIECLAMLAERNSLPGDPSRQRHQGRDRHRLARTSRRAGRSH
jgi:transposase-like protein